MADSVEIPRHTHVMKPRACFREPWCGICGMSMRFILATESSCEIARPDLPLFWTAWRDPRTDEVPRG